MFRDAQLLPIIEQIYEAATDPAGLGELAYVLARAFDTDTAALAFNEMPRPGVIVPQILGVPSTTPQFDMRMRLAYAEYYHNLNIWLMEALKKSASPVIVIGQELVDDTTLMRHEYYDYCREIGVFHLLGTTLRIGDNLAEIGILRGRRQAPFEAGDKHKMAQLRPHIQRALQLQQRLGTLERERAFSLEILEGLAIGIIVVDAKCKLLFANEIARRVLQQGAMLSVSEGRLHVVDCEYQSHLERFVGEAAQTSAGQGTAAGGIVHTKTAAKAPVSLLVSPLRSMRMGFGPALPAAAVVFTDPDDAGGSSETALAAIYGLTPAETKLLAALVEGTTLAQHAAERCISIGTVRMHLKSVLHKTGHHRQVDLVRAVTKNPLPKLAR